LGKAISQPSIVERIHHSNKVLREELHTDQSILIGLVHKLDKSELGHHNRSTRHMGMVLIILQHIIGKQYRSNRDLLMVVHSILSRLQVRVGIKRNLKYLRDSRNNQQMEKVMILQSIILLVHHMRRVQQLALHSSQSKLIELDSIPHIVK
jgi:hypothetical protein